MKVAHGFNRGLEFGKSEVPEGRLKNASTIFPRSSLRDSRWLTREPSVETLGYYRLSLRDKLAYGTLNFRRRLTFAVTFLLAAFAACGDETNSVPKSDFKFFKIVPERNIFNPKRTKYVPPSAKPKPVKIETFTFVGALGDERGRLAFFDSGSSEFQKVLKPGGMIGGLKILQVDFNHVRLFATNGKETEVPVGGQMKRLDEGEWIFNGEAASSRESVDESEKTMSSEGKSEESKSNSSRSRSRSRSSKSGSTTKETTQKPETKSSGGSEEEILKKLMQQREQELNK